MCISVVGRVVRTAGERADVTMRNRTYTVDTTLHPEARPGDYVVVEAGLIMGVITADEARELNRFHDEMAALFAEQIAVGPAAGGPAIIGPTVGALPDAETG